MRRFVASAVLALIVLAASASVAGAAPARPALSCTGTRHVFNTSTYNNVGDNSLTVTVFMQWIEDPTTHGYCGSMQPFTKVDANECTPGDDAENIQQAYIRLYTSGGTILDSEFWNGAPAGASWGCTDGDWWFYGDITPVACNTTIHAWALWVESSEALDNTSLTFNNIADGENVGGYSPTHTICVN